MEEESIIERTVPTGILTGIKFDMMRDSEIEKMSNITISESSDVTNPKLGLPNSSSRCGTCGSKSIRDCEGHFGAIKLPVAIYNPYFIAEVVQILNQICPGCLSVKHDIDTDNILLEASDKASSRDAFILKAIQKNLNGMQRKLMLSYFKECVKSARKKRKTEKQANCKYCLKNTVKWYPMIRFKILSRDPAGRRSLSIISEIIEKVPKKYQNRNLDEVLASDFWDFVPRDIQQQEPNKSKITLSPYQAYMLLKELDPDFIKKFIKKRGWIFISSIPVTSNNHRVSESHPIYSDGPLLTFDERTRAYKRIIEAGKRIEEFRQHPQFKAFAGSYVTTRVMECLSASKLYSKQQSSGERTAGASRGVRWLKDTILSKRTDHVFRMVMVGDPKVKPGQIGLPADLAKSLFITEKVNSLNYDELSSICVKKLLNEEKVQGRRDGKLMSFKKKDKIQIGDTVYRPLKNGDIVLINRPPSVHQHSLIGLTVKILDNAFVACINPLNCLPLLGDFDGDCLHGYIPQSVNCRVELSELVSLGKQLYNSQDGKCLVYLTHDSLVGASLLADTNVYLNKYEFQQLQMFCLDQAQVTPCMVKPPDEKRKLWTPLWTGSQLFNEFLPPDLDSEGKSNLPPSKWFNNDRNGVLYEMLKNYSNEGLDYLHSAQETLCEFVSMRGLTVSLSDLYLSRDKNSREKLNEEVSFALEEAEEALWSKQFILNPKMKPYLMSYDFDPDKIPDPLSQTNLTITQNSIGAFKDVFNDIIKLTSLHIQKDNSMLAMINSGSKGSLMKLAHQTVCLGLQLPVNSFPFTIPTNLTCKSWNNHKKDLEKGQSSYAIIKSSFLNGLNPLECLLHAVSGRANFFSENAEVPGVLNRELTYVLRDLYVAYDGTVRDPLANQVVQFCYGDFDEDCNGESVLDEMEREIGAPVGSWAASAVSEAAYGALDGPVGGLEESPLMNLKKVLKCDRGRGPEDRAAILYFSERVKKCKYGSEYAALEIQNRLEPVLFSDLVDTVMIMYCGRDCQGFKNSPFETHFHINKEMMKMKRISLKPLIDRLAKSYAVIRRKSEGKLPMLRISKSDGNCSSDQVKDDNSTFCLVLMADTSDLDKIKNGLIPILLKILVKGFMEIKQVEIKCSPSFNFSELFLRVIMSENCRNGTLWPTLQNACIPLMDLIDWDRSRPDNIHDIFAVFGIDSAWLHFISCLKGAITDIGKEIKREHLLTIANSLSLSGEFHGLSSRGLKLQRKRLGVSAPFSQACFAGPATSFISAAKEGATDNLCGSLDAISWGKEPSIGSGGNFDLIYSSGKEYFGNKFSVNQSDLKSQVSRCDAEVQQKEPLDIYDFLKDHVQKGPKPCLTGQLSNKRDLGPSNYSWQESAMKRPKTNTIKEKKLSLPSKYLISIGSWQNIVDMHASLHRILHENEIETCVNEADRKSLIEALTYHPRGAEKIGIGVKQIKIGLSVAHEGSRCFVLVRNNGTTDDFSYRKCIIGAASRISSELESLVRDRFSVPFSRFSW
ncbi:hypothetical protein LUZ60_016329 [Juncus effusus]|nr:hypothetical protein LUZ60_016329 [Juncus effusus]